MDITEVIDYIYDIIGIRIEICPLQKNILGTINYHLRGLFGFHSLRIQGNDLIMIEEKGPHFTPFEIYEHISILRKKLKREIIILRNNMTSYNRLRLIKYKVGFIIPGKQMYIPEMMIDLRENYNIEPIMKSKLKPATQFVLLWHLLRQDLSGMTVGEVLNSIFGETKHLNIKFKPYSLMTVSRAIRELNQIGLCSIKGTKRKRIQFPESKKKILRKALPVMINPVTKEMRLFISPDRLHDKYLAGISALSVYSDIASGRRDEAYAVFYKSPELEDLKKWNPYEFPEKYFYLQIWKYDPVLLSPDGKTVDPVSLYLTFRHDKDERIQKAIEDTLRRAV